MAAPGLQHFLTERPEAVAEAERLPPVVLPVRQERVALRVILVPPTTLVMVVDQSQTVRQP